MATTQAQAMQSHHGERPSAHARAIVNRIIWLPEKIVARPGGDWEERMKTPPNSANVLRANAPPKGSKLNRPSKPYEKVRNIMLEWRAARNGLAQRECVGSRYTMTPAYDVVHPARVLARKGRQDDHLRLVFHRDLPPRPLLANRAAAGRKEWMDAVGEMWLR